MLEQVAEETGQKSNLVAFYAGFESRRNGNLQESEKWFQIAAEEGHVDSLHLLGSQSLSRKETNKDEPELVEVLPTSSAESEDFLRYFSDAAKEGQEFAMFNLGYLYANGLEQPKDLTKAKEWYAKAATQGHAGASFELGKLFEEEGNLEKAIEMYEKAAKGGSVDAARSLGLFYFFGKGVNKDHHEATKYFRLAGDNTSLYYLGWIVRNEGQKVSSEVTSAMSFETALESLRKLASSGDKEAQRHLGKLYASGTEGVERDEEEARKWLELAANQGDLHSQFALCELELSSLGDDRSKAQEIFARVEALAEEGLPDAKLFVAFDYLNGHICGKKKPEEAARIYTQLAYSGNPTACYELGKLFRKGLGVKRDLMEAVDLFQRSAKIGHMGSAQSLAEMYFTGEGVEESEEKAIQVLLDSGEQTRGSALYVLACVIDQHKGSRKDPKTVASLLERSAAEGHPEAIHAMGTIAEDNDEIEKAFQYYTEAANKGVAAANCSLYFLYKDGKGVRKDEKEALRLLELAVEQGDLDAHYYLSNLYYTGTLVKKNLNMVEALLSRAAEAGHMKSLEELGLLYCSGKDFPENKLLGLSCLTNAASQGSERALGILMKIQGGQKGLSDIMKAWEE